MAWLKEQFEITCNNHHVGSYYVYEDHTYRYYVSNYLDDLGEVKDLLSEKGLLCDLYRKSPITAIENMMKESNRVKGRKRPTYVDGPLTVTRIPKDTGTRFLVYRCGANKGEEGYSEAKHSAPHYEGPNTPEGMKEWTTWYAFEAMDDGTFVAALDESWWWGGGHNDGGTIRNDIPEEWFELPYEEFLDHVLSLSAARHYGFTVEELKNKKGLKEFFGFS